MKIIEVRKAGRDVTVSALKSKNYEKLKLITEAAKNNAKIAFDAISSGSMSVAWYDMPAVKTASGAVSVMRHVLHQSPKRDGFLQLSCIEIKNGQDIPTSDLQFNISDGFGDFFRELPTKATIFIE